MKNPPYDVLFLCTGNSARSVMAEALLNRLGEGRFRAYSAGSHPSGKVQPVAAELAQAFGYAEPLRSKSWDEFAQADSPAIDIVITVCDNAASETCPIWLGEPLSAHWGVPDPVSASGDNVQRRRAFESAWHLLRRRIEALIALPLETLDDARVSEALRVIGQTGAVDES